MNRLRIGFSICMAAAVLVLWLGKLNADDCNDLTALKLPCGGCAMVGPDHDNGKCAGANGNKAKCTYHRETYDIPTMCVDNDNPGHCVAAPNQNMFVCCTYATCVWIAADEQCTWNAAGVVVQSVMSNYVFNVTCPITP